VAARIVRSRARSAFVVRRLNFNTFVLNIDQRHCPDLRSSIAATHLEEPVRVSSPNMSDRKAYPGSCHCGAVRYQVKLKFPPIHDPTAETIRIYKCNCTTCQKMGMFHCRPINPTEDYILTSPASIEELGDYRCYEKKHGWYFCKSCGVRILGLGGSWEQVEIDVEKWAGTKVEGEEEKPQKVWKTKGDPITVEVDGKKFTRPYYLSINAVTLEPSEDIDLRKWHDNRWLFYVENLKKDGTPLRVGEPVRELYLRNVRRILTSFIYL